MKNKLWKLYLLPLISILILSACGEAEGDQEINYPERDIRVVVPYAPGGGTDMIARAVVENIDIDANTNISNLEGAGASLGTMEVVEAQPDGYTLLAHSVTAIASGHHVDVYDKPIYEDLIPIATVTTQEGGIAVHADSEFETAEDFISYAEENPGELNISNAGLGGGTHIVAAAFENSANIEVTHVPFDGTAPSSSALAGGHVDAIAGYIPELSDYLIDGQFKLLATTGEERSPHFDEVPTFKELGFDFTMAPKYGFFAPAGTPDEIVEILSEKLEEVTMNEDYIEFMDNIMSTSDYLGPEEFEEELVELESTVDEISDVLNE